MSLNYFKYIFRIFCLSKKKKDNSMNVFKHILSLPIIEKDTITNLCRDGNFSFIESDKELINFDKLAKKFGDTTSSPDALTEKNGEIYFIEFKNQIKPKTAELIKKLYGGITVFAHFSDSEALTGEIKIKYFILCHREKTKKTDPMIDTFSKVLKSSGNEITDIDKQKLNKNKQQSKDEVIHSSNHLHLTAQALSKYSGINIEIEILLFEDERKKFIESL